MNGLLQARKTLVAAYIKEGFVCASKIHYVRPAMVAQTLKLDNIPRMTIFQLLKLMTSQLYLTLFAFPTYHQASLFQLACHGRERKLLPEPKCKIS